MMSRRLSFLAIVLIFLSVPVVEAQRPKRGGQAGGRPGGGLPPQERNRANPGGVLNQRPGTHQVNQGFANPNFFNQNANQNMPSVADLAQKIIANFDSDGSGELSQVELQGALSMLQGRMQNQMGVPQRNDFANQRNGIANLQNGVGNQMNPMQRGRNLQANQAFGNRPPRGRGGGR